MPALLPQGDRHLFGSRRARMQRGLALLAAVPLVIAGLYAAGYLGWALVLPLAALPFAAWDLYRAATRPAD